MTRAVIPYQDFSGGDSGRERPAVGDLTRYRGINTWLYPNGAIAPRPAWSVIGITGLPTGKTLRTFTTTVGGGSVWYAFSFSDGTVYTTTNSAPLTAALRGTLGNDPSDALAVGESVIFISNAGTGGGKVDKSGAYVAVTAPQADLLVQHGSQTVAVNQQTSILYWSAPDDPTSWPAANAVIVGDAIIATGLYVQRNTILVLKLNGDMWMFTGTLGVNEVLRKVDNILAHPLAGRAKGAVVGGSSLVYTAGSKMVIWTGAQPKAVMRPDLIATTGFDSSPKTDNVGAITCNGEPNQFVVAGTMDSTSSPTTRRPWMQTFSPDRGWGRHTLPVSDYVISASALGGTGVTSTDSSKGIRLGTHVAGTLVACFPSDAAGQSTISVLNLLPRLETPYTVSVPMQWGGGSPATAITDAATGLPVVASIQSAEFWAPEGQEATVRSLIVDYSWDSDSAIQAAMGSAVPHRFDITVEALERQDGSSQDSTSIAFVPTSGTSYAIDGGSIRRGRKVFSFGDQGAGGGFRWKLADWRGIMIHSVQAVVDLTPARI